MLLTATAPPSTWVEVRRPSYSRPVEAALPRAGVVVDEAVPAARQGLLPQPAGAPGVAGPDPPGGRTWGLLGMGTMRGNSWPNGCNGGQQVLRGGARPIRPMAHHAATARSSGNASSVRKVRFSDLTGAPEEHL